MSFTDYYNELKNNKNNISYWYPKIKNCGIHTPETFITEVPEVVVKACFMEGDQQKCIDTIYNWVKTDLMDKIPSNLRGLLFIKNGAFSNKFDFNTACARYVALDITRSIIEINYTSFMFETGGNTELAIRERIMSNDNNTPCIYRGMPLHNEYRVFYDFDKNKALYVVNYWDWNYCHEAISRDATDKIVYESVYPELEKHYNKNCNKVMQLVDDAMKKVTGLDGIWSVDIMEANNELWLIDMAVGNQSAYWNPELIK